VKGTPAEAHLAALRTRFAPATGFGVLDGLRLQQEGPGTITEPEVLVAAEGMSDALDAVADALTAEAVYQIVKGNPENALATLERIAKGEEPPALTVTQSPAPGVRLTHRVAVVLPATAAAPGWPLVRTPRANAEPLLDAWCGLMLGPAARNIEMSLAPSPIAIVSSSGMARWCARIFRAFPFETADEKSVSSATP